MPWSIRQKGGRYCVIKDSDGSTAGCHSSRAQAIKQQRALYANESRMASVYAELDAQPEDYGWVEEIPNQIKAPLTMPEEGSISLSPFAAELVGLILKDEREKSLTASLAGSMAAISERMEREREERGALVAALSQIGSPVINVPPAEVSINVPPAEVKVDVAAAEVNIPPAQITVEAPNVTVRPEIVMPAPGSRKVTFERDPSGKVKGATVEE